MTENSIYLAIAGLVIFYYAGVIINVFIAYMGCFFLRCKVDHYQGNPNGLFSTLFKTMIDMFFRNFPSQVLEWIFHSWTKTFLIFKVTLILITRDLDIQFMDEEDEDIDSM
jgi:hypothetical protein